ncbi:MAG: glycosyltransferase family 9 protein [Chitinophagaceae bacterium]|nr:MAG: glycosyltransferase family 9 protein [Chitinophagaceae bacterium]
MEKMKILVRLPNWLGDMVMAVGALRQLPEIFPGAEVSVIVKKGLQDLLPFFPPTKHWFVFSKEEYNGLRGAWRFGKMIRRTERFDLFISFPDSFSSALVGFATGAKKRVGYRKEARDILLTNVYAKPKNIHRVEEYSSLLEFYAGKKVNSPKVSLFHSFSKKDHIVININSEAQSRRLTVFKAVEVISAVRRNVDAEIFLVGSGKEAVFVEEVLALLPGRERITSLAGKTTLPQLVEVLASARAVLTTDSGPAHLANALGTQTVVLFGAGNEANTAPYEKELLQVIRLGQLSCEPCTKNVCVRFEKPQCLERLDTQFITTTLQQRLAHVD